MRSMASFFRCALVVTIGCVVTSTAAAQPAQPDQPTHREIDSIRLEIGNEGRLETFSMNSQGNLLAAVTWLEKKPGAQGDPPATDDPDFWDYWDEHREIQVLDGSGGLLRKINIQGIVPLQIHSLVDGSIYLGGEYLIAKIGPNGKLVQKVKIVDVIPNTAPDVHISGLAISDKYLFVAIGSGRSLRATEEVVRLDRDLKNPITIVDRQFGCCSHIDMAVHGSELLVAENSRHRVNRFSFDGELLGRWGKRDRTGIEGFAACCNPVNFDLHDGLIVTAESGVGRVKSFAPDGTFNQLIGYVDTTKFDRGSRVAAASCYIPVEVSPDGIHIFVMDVRANSIRVLKRISS